MNILWFSHRDITHSKSGGAERTIYEISKRLVERGHKVKWISTNEGNEHKQEIIYGIDVQRIPGNVNVHFKTHSIIREVKPDVIIDDLGHAVPWGSELLTKIPGTVFFRHLHRRSLKGQVSFPLRVSLSSMEILYPILYRKWTFVTETDSSIEDLENLHIDKKRIVKIPPGVDFNMFKPLQRTEHPTIVYFGGFRDYKRPWEALFVLKDTLRENNRITLKMIGSGPSLSHVKSMSKGLGIEKNVQFLGKLDTSKLAEIVGKAWVNIHSSVTEGFGYSILESSAAGTPTVAYKVPGVRDVVKDGVNGYLVEEKRRDLMGKKVLDVINDMDNLSNASVSEAHRYSWDRTTEQWESHLKRIIYQF